MTWLRDLQRDFAAGVFHATSPDLIKNILPGRFRPQQHFQVYRNNVFASLTSALKTVYPVVERLVGEEFFRHASESYIRRYRPHSGNLHDFGEHFAIFLAEFSPARELVYLPDVARLEWARHRSFHAAGEPPLRHEALASLTTEQHARVKFQLQPSVFLMDSIYPVLRIWEVNQSDYQGDQSIDLDQGGVKLMVIRRRDVTIEALCEGDYALLSAFAADDVFARAAEIALQAQPGFDLAAALDRHLSAESFAGIAF